MPDPVRSYVCGLCFKATGSVLPDKNGRPYLYCHGCRSRTFTRSPRSIAAAIFWGEVIEQGGTPLIEEATSRITEIMNEL